MNIKRSKTITEQVNEILRERIRNATYAPGDRLPAENELAQEFEVSRATIRSVLARLDMEGLILRKQGDGTYINERLLEVNTHLGGLWEFTHLIQNNGYQPSIKLLMAQYRPATAEEAEKFDIEVEDEVLVMERTFLADNRPVIFARNILPAAWIQAPQDKIDGSLHIREFVKVYCKQDIAYAISDISAVIADERVSSILKHDILTPLLKLDIRFYDKSNAPLLYGVSYFDDSILNLRLVQAWA